MFEVQYVHQGCEEVQTRPHVQVRTICVSPNGQLLLSIDEDGRSLLINRERRTLLHHFTFKKPVAVAKFSPDGRFVACAVGRLLQVCLPSSLPLYVTNQPLHTLAIACACS